MGMMRGRDPCGRSVGVGVASSWIGSTTVSTINVGSGDSVMTEVGGGAKVGMGAVVSVGPGMVGAVVAEGAVVGSTLVVGLTEVQEAVKVKRTKLIIIL